MSRKLNLAIQVHDDVVVLEDPWSGETYTRPRTQLVDVDMVNMVAEFTLVRDAKKFAATYLTEGRSFEGNVTFETPRRVRWTAVVEYDPPVNSKAIYAQDILENAGSIAGTGARVGWSSVTLDHALPEPRVRATHVH